MISKLAKSILTIALLGICALAQNEAQTKTVDVGPNRGEWFEANVSDVPPQDRLQTNTLREKRDRQVVLDQERVTSSESSMYYWRSTPVGNSAQLLTLFCRACNILTVTERDVPVVSVLRDTLGDQDNENDRVTYIWLLTYAHRRLGQRVLSAIPFFYWRVGQGSGSVSAHDTTPLMDLSAPEQPMMAQIERNLIQSNAFDPAATAVRASTQAYRSKGLDDERLHLEEAISFLRQAPVSNDPTDLTQAQLDTVIGRLQLRKTLLGGLVTDNQAALAGMQSSFEQERIHSRNLELLRQWAEKTQLIFEPLNLAGSQEHYAVLWFPQKESPALGGSSLRSIWKLLGIRNPWNDERLKNWKGPIYERVLDENDTVKVIPLAVYSLDYPKLPLILIDFRNKLSGRKREVRPRFVSELTGGVLGLSHFTNWYFFIAWDSYHFVTGRHGKAVDEAARLDCYADFRMQLALDHNTDPSLKQDMESRIGSLAVSPLGAAPQREIQAAIERYELLEVQAGGGRLMARVDQERRFEISSFGEGIKARVAKSILHVATLGLYNQRARNADIFILDRDRRVAYQLNFLNSLVQAGTPPEVAYDSEQIQSSVRELSSLVVTFSSARVRSQAEATLEHLKKLSKDADLQTACTTALAAMKQTDALKSVRPAGVAALSRGRDNEDSSANPEEVK